MPSNLRIQDSAGKPVGAANPLPVGGPVADNDASLTPNPVMSGGKALSANPAAAATGRVMSFLTTLIGALITKPFSLPEADWTYAGSAAITNTTAVTLKAAAGAGIKNYLTAIQLKNTSTTATAVTIKEGSNTIWYGYLGASMTIADCILFPTPLRSAANAALSIVCATTAASVYVNAQGYSAP